MKFQNTNNKLQINLKSQSSNLQITKRKIQTNSNNLNSKFQTYNGNNI